jgi:hypothetical protein
MNSSHNSISILISLCQYGVQWNLFATRHTPHSSHLNVLNSSIIIIRPLKKINSIIISYTLGLVIIITIYYLLLLYEVIYIRSSIVYSKVVYYLLLLLLIIYYYYYYYIIIIIIYYIVVVVVYSYYLCVAMMYYGYVSSVWTMTFTTVAA